MEGKFTVIGITHPFPGIDGEAGRITALLESGAINRIHIRKPGIADVAVMQLLDMIPRRLHSQLSLHDCHHLAAKYPGIGIHLNRRNPDITECSGTVSRSCHSVEELTESTTLDYVTLSPVFDSISKPGYRAITRDITTLSTLLSTRRVIALGGVTPQSFGLLKELGFSGGAMLGYLWYSTRNIDDIIQEIKLCCNS